MGAALQAINVQLKVLSGRGIVGGQNRGAASLQLAKKMALATGAYTLYTMLQQGDEEYEEMDDYERDRMIYLGGNFGIPVRHDISMIPKLIAEHGYNLLDD